MYDCPGTPLPPTSKNTTVTITREPNAEPGIFKVVVVYSVSKGQLAR